MAGYREEAERRGGRHREGGVPARQGGGRFNIPLPAGAAGADPRVLASAGRELGRLMQPGGMPDVYTLAGGGGDYYYPPERTELDLAFDALDLNYADRQAAREENRRQFDENLRYQYWAAKEAEAGATARANAAAAAGLEGDRTRAQADIERAQIAAANALQIAQLDNASRERIADKEFATRLKEMASRERITAAETWARPIDYLAYSRWMAGQPAATTESGLPVGAPGWQTGEPVQAVGAGGVPTGDIYGQKLAAGGRIQEFGAWGGPTTPVGGTPWISPHQANVTQFAAMPAQAQEMAYARWRQRGIMPETAQQAMYAAAPTGTARQVGYG